MWLATGEYFRVDAFTSTCSAKCSRSALGRNEKLSTRYDLIIYRENYQSQRGGKFPQTHHSWSFESLSLQYSMMYRPRRAHISIEIRINNEINGNNYFGRL